MMPSALHYVAENAQAGSQRWRGTAAATHNHKCFCSGTPPARHQPTCTGQAQAGDRHPEGHVEESEVSQPAGLRYERGYCYGCGVRLQTSDAEVTEAFAMVTCTSSLSDSKVAGLWAGVVSHTGLLLSGSPLAWLKVCMVAMEDRMLLVACPPPAM
jgi:hypothetical protein